PPPQLAANERRRTTATVRLALAAAFDAVAQAEVDPAALAGVFASPSGDNDVLHALCHATSQPTRAVSPTQFHNSVHNAPGGYWSLATRSPRPLVSLSAREGTFAAGLLEAYSWAVADDCRVLLVVYEQPAPPPLASGATAPVPFAVAAVLCPRPTPHSWAQLTPLATPLAAAPCPLLDPGLEALRLANPAARALPLLAALAEGTAGRVGLDHGPDGPLAVEVAPFFGGDGP
ncbi:MAG: beta-ketoacyl synthase chain length factor, partial [Candidatus Competibacterales bacterium]